MDDRLTKYEQKVGQAILYVDGASNRSHEWLEVVPSRTLHSDYELPIVYVNGMW